MKKIIAIVLVILAAACVVSGCSGKPADNKQPKSAAEVYADVSAAGGLSAMTPVPARDYNEIYGVDTSKVGDSAWYMSDNPSLNADEVAVFLLSDASYAADLVKLLEGRVARQLSVAESYSPDEAGKLKQTVVTTAVNAAGTWVYYCVGTEYAKMMDAFRRDCRRSGAAGSAPNKAEEANR